MAGAPENETWNVLVSAVIIGGLVMLFSISVLYILTGDIYLDAYYTIEAFFYAPNSAASFQLAQIAFAGNAYTFWPIVGIVVLDNLSNMLVVSFVIAAVLDIIRYIDLEETINSFKTGRMRGHVIICGYNEVASGLIAKLMKKGTKIAVLEHKKETAEVLARQKIPTITGKATESDDLRRAGIENAKEIVFTSHNDIDNLVGAITAKRLNPKIKILCRVTNDEVRTKMYRVGVEMCVLPEYLAGVELGEKLAKIAK
ncbi:MAG: NAD-binding protein [Candidatus Micrarchaeota archaeon]|nr:NAD-binding protein [Candidatus Micrarchaeota archaeon]